MLAAFSFFLLVLFSSLKAFTGCCNSQQGVWGDGRTRWDMYPCSYWQSQAISASSEGAQVPLVQPHVAAVLQEQLKV